MTPQPSRPAASGRARASTLVHCPAATRVFSAKAPIPSAGASTVPSARVIFWVALWVAKQYCGLPRRHDRHWPHTARQLRTTKSPGRDGGDIRADGFDDAGRLVAEEERELVVDPALAIVQVGVAYAAGLDAHERLSGARVGHEHRRQLDRSALLPGDDASYLVNHPVLPSKVCARAILLHAGGRRAVDSDWAGARVFPQHDQARRGTSWLTWCGRPWSRPNGPATRTR